MIVSERLLDAAEDHFRRHVMSAEGLEVQDLMDGVSPSGRYVVLSAAYFKPAPDGIASLGNATRAAVYRVRAKTVELDGVYDLVGDWYDCLVQDDGSLVDFRTDLSGTAWEIRNRKGTVASGRIFGQLCTPRFVDGTMFLEMGFCDATLARPVSGKNVLVPKVLAFRDGAQCGGALTRVITTVPPLSVAERRPFLEHLEQLLEAVTAALVRKPTDKALRHIQCYAESAAAFLERTRQAPHRGHHELSVVVHHARREGLLQRSS